MHIELVLGEITPYVDEFYKKSASSEQVVDFLQILV